ncbi:MAG TPA: hypothetical protein VL173_11100 [Vicinamibacterales bacterium]|nr:hypothetical protein [Vicinamibacterales bacterium]
MNRPVVTRLVLAFTLFVPTAAAPAEIVRPPLVVRSYEISPVSPAEWLAARREATDVLNDAGIDVEWIDCSGAPPRPDVRARCDAPLKRDEVAVRLVRRVPPAYAGPLPLGEALVDPRLGSGTLATIYVDRVEWFAREGHANSGTLLGRALAHELGHLLLGDAHTSGLMRPCWTRDDLLRARAADWTFTAADAARLRSALAGRTTMMAACPDACRGNSPFSSKPTS